MNQESLQALSDADLAALIQAVQAEQARRSNSVQSMRVTVGWGSYNERRYGRPWIARISAWPVGAHPELEFGRFVGTHGCAGATEIIARPGDILRYGQKDNRGNNSESYWGVVQADGTVQAVSQAEARDLYKGA